MLNTSDEILEAIRNGHTVVITVKRDGEEAKLTHENIDGEPHLIHDTQKYEQLAHLFPLEIDNPEGIDEFLEDGATAEIDDDWDPFEQSNNND